MSRQQGRGMVMGKFNQALTKKENADADLRLGCG
jgi:hypothetical protein